jgi:tRNA(Ile)-lysidine synthase TilS/MesJ
MNCEYKNITSNIEEVFKNFFIKKQIAVAISGGCDSVALTFALNDFCKENKIKIYALTIDHGVRKNSKIEASSLSLRRIALKNLNKSDFDDNKVVSPAV